MGGEPGHTVVDRKVDQHTKKVHNVKMTWRAGKKGSIVSVSKNWEKKKLQHLLKELTRSLEYRNVDDNVVEPYVVVEGEVERGHNYRIECASPYDVGDSEPVLDLRYYIDEKAYAVVKVHLKPKKGPMEFKDVLIDQDGEWIAFKPQQVMEQIDDGMIYSLENDCEVEIEWEIEIPS